MGVIVDDFPERILLPFDLFRFQSIFFHLPLDQITLRNLKFLALGVARQRNHFDPVAQRFGYAIDVIRRPDENDLRQIERHIEITIDKRVVLSRIENFEQRARGVAAEIGADLVDLIKHEHRIARPYAAQFLNDATWHRADVGAAVAANFRFVAHSAEADPDKFTAERVGD